jgi:hypoxanthine phosphoribosyltransferase
MSNIKKIHINHVKNGVQEILRQMHLDHFRPDYVVGITRGGLFPAVMISHYLKVPMYALDISLRDNVQQGPESNCWMAADAFGALDSEDVAVFKNRWDMTKRKKILIVEDINDSGATLEWLKKDWMSGCFPDEKATWDVVWDKNVKFAVLLNNEASSFDGVDYQYESINKLEDPNIWIDFPWESWWLD